MQHAQKVVVGGVVVVVLMGGSFWGGMQYEKGQAPALGVRGGAGQYAGGGFGGQGGAGAGARGMRGAGGGFISGSVVSSDAQSVTVSLAAGGSKVVYLSDSTRVLKSAAGTLTDLQPGTNVMISGTPNQDGSVVAQSIQIRPEVQKVQGQ